MNKAFAWIPLAFVIGGLVGYWGPSSDLQELEKRAKNVEKAKAAPARSDGFGSFASMVNIPAPSGSRRRKSREKPAAEAAPSGGASESASPGKEPAEASQKGGEEPKRPTPEDLRSRIEEASELWRTRIDLAKARTVEKFGLDASGQAKFEDALEGLNARLRDSIQAIADILAEQESMTPELGIRLMGDVTTAMAETYDAIGECVPEDMRGEVSNLQMTDFIDPMVAEPLIAVQGKLEPEAFQDGDGRRGR